MYIYTTSGSLRFAARSNKVYIFRIPKIIRGLLCATAGTRFVLVFVLRAALLPVPLSTLRRNSSISANRSCTSPPPSLTHAYVALFRSPRLRLHRRRFHCHSHRLLLPCFPNAVATEFSIRSCCHFSVNFFSSATNWFLFNVSTNLWQTIVEWKCSFFDFTKHKLHK